MSGTPRLPRGPRPVQSRPITYLDLAAIYAAVKATQDGLVPVIAARTDRREATYYQQQERVKGDLDNHRRPWLYFQVLKQQVALESKPRELACAELICEADHLGADVVWREQSAGGAVDLVTRLGAIMAEVGDVSVEMRAALADKLLTESEAPRIKQQLRELRVAADQLERCIDLMVGLRSMDQELGRLSTPTSASGFVAAANGEGEGR